AAAAPPSAGAKARRSARRSARRRAGRAGRHRRAVTALEGIGWNRVIVGPPVNGNRRRGRTDRRGGIARLPPLLYNRSVARFVTVQSSACNRRRLFDEVGT